MSNNDNMIKLVRLFEGTQFAGEPEQKPGDQVRGTDKAVVKGRQHPFHNRLVGEEISLEDKLSKRYQDMKDVQAKEKEQKKKEELDEQGVAEGMLGNPGEQDSPVSQAITRRILLQRTDLLSKYGPVKVMAAIDEVADFVGDVEEIGSSDVSGWVRHVEQMLGNMSEQGVTEGSDDLRDSVLEVIKTIYNGARAGEDMIDYLADEFGQYYDEVEASGDQSLQNAYTYMMDNGQEAEDNPRAMAKIAVKTISMLKQGMAEGWNDDDDFFARADHSGKSGVAVDRSVPGRTIGRLSNRPRDSEKPEKPFRPSNTKDTGRTTGHRSSAVQPRFGYDSANPGYSRARFGEGENPADKITLDVPLMIRIMEYAREDAKDDVDLHNVAEQLVRLSAMGKTLGMNDYEGIVGVTTEQKLSELGAVPPAPQGTATATANAAPTSGSVSPDEQTALNKIQTNPAMKQQFDKLMTQATPGAANKPMALDPEQADALDKIKTNAGLKGQYDRLIKQANPGATP